MKGSRKNIESAGGALFLLLIVLGLFSLKTALGGAQDREPLNDSAGFIEIAGDIPNPGVIRFSEPATLKAVLERAGVPDRKASYPGVNPDSTLPSGTRVDFRDSSRKVSVRPGKMSPFYRMTLGMPVHLNDSSADGLSAVPGIGPGLAASIVDEREKRQGFSTLDELAEVRGISRKLLKKIRPFLML